MANHKHILEGQWKEGRDFVPDLLRAKAESDRKNYSAKHDILRRLIQESPGEFLIDSEESGIYGITHRPSGFKIHLLKDVTPPELTRAQPEKQDKATVLNRIMEKHSRPGTKEEVETLYHGSPTGGIAQLEPRLHRLTPKPSIFATSDENLALSMSVPASEDELAMGYEEDTDTGKREFYIDELQPGKLSLLDAPAYLYDLPASTFSQRGAHPELMQDERISHEPVTPSRVREIKNVLQELRNRNATIRPYDEIPEEKWAEAAQVVGSSDVDKATVLNRIMKKHSRPGTKKQEDDVYVNSSVPAASLDMVKKHGLLSSQALLTNPEALASLLDSRRESGPHFKGDEESFKKKVEERLKDDAWSESMKGPSVFFGEPDPDKITDVHPTRKIKSETLRVNLSKLLRDHPKTRIMGSELHPYDPEGPEHQWDSRHHDIDLDKVREYVATDPKELWKHYNSPEGTHYAGDVPHGQLITPSGGVPPEYLEFTDTQEAIFDKLKEHLPEGARHSSGGMPDVRGTSDVDVSLYHSDPAQVFELLPKGTTIRSQREDTGSIEYAVPGYSRDVNVYVTSDPDAAQRSVDHRRTEIALQEQFPELYQSAIALKRDGRNTEQAWAETLGVKNDPYAAMRDTKAMLAAAATLNKQDTDFGKQAADKKQDKAMVKRLILADAINSLISKETGVRKDLADALVQSGVPTTVVTNAPPEGIREQLSEYPFDVYSKQGEPRKEDPEFFRELLKEKQVSPEEVFYFDHNPANLAAARKAGIRGVPYASDISNRRDLIVLLSSLSKEKPAKKKPADVYIIRGNPGVDTEHAAEYDAFYDAIKKNVEARGLTAEFDPGLAYTSPPGGKYWIAHSRGKSRLRGAPKNVQTLALDDYEPAEARQRQAEHNQKMFKALGVTNVAGIPRDQRLQPGPEHYTFNDDMRAALDNMFLSEQDKVAHAVGSSASEKATVLKRIMKKHSHPGTKASDRGGLKPDVKLQPHQQRIVDTAGPGIRKLLYHGLGSGKTLSAIAAAEKTQQPYGVVVPAALRPNFAKEQEKFTDEQLASDIQSYTMLARGHRPKHTGTVIMDEAHRLRNPDTEQTRVAKQLAEATDQLYLLSGSPIVNAPADLAPLMEMLTQETTTPEAFNEKYLSSKPVTPSWIDRWKGVTPGVVHDIKNKKKLHDALRGKVDYHEPAESPVAREEERIVVDMSPEQEQLHNEFYGTLPSSLRRKLDMQFPLSKSEQRSFLAFLSGPRQVALSTAPWQSEEDRAKTGLSQSPKLQRAISELEAQIEEDPESRAVVFSNFITAGLEPYAAALEAKKIPHGIFHGGLNDKQRAELVNKYNSGDLRVLLMGPSGGEGLSLEGTKLIQLLDPHWNETRLNQAIGRGIRYDSHKHLPEKDRKVKVQRFISQLPEKKQKGLLDMLSVLLGRGKPVRGADAHLENYARDKQRLNDLFLAELKNIGTEKGSVSKQAAEEQWIGVDLDGTLAKYRGWKGATHIGTPIPSMVSRVKRWLREGKVVKIFTARAAGDDGTARRAIEKWCETHIGKVLPITCVKDKNCVRIWDDRAVGVKSNKGRQVKLEYADKLTAAVKLAKARSNKSKDKEASANVLGLAVNICLVNHSSVS